MIFPPFLARERYRELIEAADSITIMKTSIDEVNLQFQKMREMTSVEYLSGLAKTNEPPGSSEAEERKTKMYRIACQIKLLVDTPEQIWHALEGAKYLVACRLFLIARQIYNNLQSRNEKDLKVLVRPPFFILFICWSSLHQFLTPFFPICSNNSPLSRNNGMRSATFAHRFLTAAVIL